DGGIGHAGRVHGRQAPQDVLLGLRADRDARSGHAGPPDGADHGRDRVRVGVGRVGIVAVVPVDLEVQPAGRDPIGSRDLVRPVDPGDQAVPDRDPDRPAVLDGSAIQDELVGAAPGLAQPRSPVSVMPSTIRRRRTRNAINVGSIAITAPALVRPKSTLVLANCDRPSSIGKSVGLLRIRSGQMKAVQAWMKARIASAEIAGPNSRGTNRSMIPVSDMPSMRAASSSSSGTLVCVFWRMKKIP